MLLNLTLLVVFYSSFNSFNTDGDLSPIKLINLLLFLTLLKAFYLSLKGT